MLLHFHLNIHRLENPGRSSQIVVGELSAALGARSPHRLWPSYADISDDSRVGIPEACGVQVTAMFRPRVALSSPATADGGLVDVCAFSRVGKLYLVGESGRDQSGMEPSEDVVESREAGDGDGCAHHHLAADGWGG